ncbi:unnamed protein product, partial [Vitis vinifera]|uniref:Tafazzin family protein n=1 Tax=Vitis vinifera TaxID=29760 RepID=D7TST2_VITVI
MWKCVWYMVKKSCKKHCCIYRPKNKPLITLSNHVASMDDPLVIASLLPPSALLNAQSLRWTMCATDRCFKNPMTHAFFRCVKVLPVSLGDGIYQTYYIYLVVVYTLYHYSS